MDGREGMPLSGSASYYLNRGIGGSNNVHGSSGGSATSQTGGINSSGFRSITNPNFPVQHTNVGYNGGGGLSGSTFQVENPPSANSGHDMSMPNVMSSAPQGGEMVKKKRGRPRKYGPGGANMSLGLSSISASKCSSGEDITTGEKARKGRPPGSGWKQQLAQVGEWMSSSAGLAFTPHILNIGVGEDVAAKILAFAQQRARALCILSANGAVSAVTLRQPTSPGDTITYEGHFEILCLSGSYLLAETGGPHNRTGGISISVCTPDGKLIGGSIGGKLIASNPVQVVACSFVYGSAAKATKNKPESVPKDGTSYLLDNQLPAEKTPALSVNNTAAPRRSITSGSGTSVWPFGSWPNDAKNEDIDMTRG